MSNVIYSLIRSMAGLENGTACRSCHESIHPRDAFGISESVCEPCRSV